MAASALQDRSAFPPTSGAPRRQNPGSLPFSEISTAAPCGGAGREGPADACRGCGPAPGCPSQPQHAPTAGRRFPGPGPTCRAGKPPGRKPQPHPTQDRSRAQPPTQPLVPPPARRPLPSAARAPPLRRGRPLALAASASAAPPLPPALSARCPCCSRSPRRAPHSQGVLSPSPPLRETPPSQFPIPPPFAPHATSHRHLAPFPSSMRTYPRRLPQLSELPPLLLPFFPGSFASPGSGHPWEVLRLTWEEGAC